MRDKHRADILDAHRLTVKTLQDMILVLRDDVEYLRAKVDDRAYVAPSRPPLNPTNQPPAEAGLKLYLSEEEEELLAANLAGHIDDMELAQLRDDLNLPMLEPDD